MANKKFFTNTYITGSGRQNYLRPDYLEDPLFTSFTFDIDFITSPLFYTINQSEYGYPDSNAIGDSIKIALEQMYAQNMGADQGYDILPVMSADFFNDIKLGFGLQQNIYMDLPLYGATEYIYMVDVRNGSSAQNDVRYADNGGTSTAANSYKLGDSVKEVVNESDAMWAASRSAAAQQQVEDCKSALNEEQTGSPEDSDYTPTIETQHKNNENNMNAALEEYNNIKETVRVFSNEGDSDGDSDGGQLEEFEYSEEEIEKEIEKYKGLADQFDDLKSKIVDWANRKLSDVQNLATEVYRGNDLVKKIASYSDLPTCNDERKKTYYNTLHSQFTDNFVEKYFVGSSNAFAEKIFSVYKDLLSYATGCDVPFKSMDEDSKNSLKDSGSSFLVENKSGDGGAPIRLSLLVNDYKKELEELGLLSDGDMDANGDYNPKWEVQAKLQKAAPDWIVNLKGGFADFAEKCASLLKAESSDMKFDNVKGKVADAMTMAEEIMTYQCDTETSFNDKFTSDIIKKNNDTLAALEAALDNIRTRLYGYEDGVGPRTKDNPSSDSPYGKYINAKNTYENDDYTQAQNALKMAESGVAEMADLSGQANDLLGVDGSLSNDEISRQIEEKINKPNVNYSVAPRTVLDMLGFISGMKKMTTEYPYIIQGITGLDNAYNKHYNIKDPYMGSGDDKISLTCWESLDLRVSSMFNRYFNAVYDRQYRRERVPVNMRRFNCSVYVHDVRNFVARSKGEYANRINELTDMYYSVIEFKFFDCEIVPEETGNIFGELSNEAPSDMKKTNFTFTYGNCVVNFVPNSKVTKIK